MPIYKMQGKNEEGLQRYKVRINYRDSFGEGKQLSRITYGLQQAKMLEIQLQSEKKEPRQGLLLKDLYQIYYNDKKYNVRETSLNKTETAFRVHILPVLGDVSMGKLNVIYLQKWKQSLHDKELSITTKKNMFTELRTFLNWCYKNGYIHENPLNKVDNFRDAYVTNKKEVLRFYTAEQFKKYIAVALDDAQSTNNYNYYVFFMIAFYTGMRKGEINALKWSDIEDHKINVKRSIAQKLRGEDRETPPKNKSSYRTLQCPKPLVKVLEEQRARHKAITKNIDDFRVCGGEFCLRDTTIDSKNRTYSILAELPRIKIHEFRHSHASLLANAGINIQEIARRLGHSNIEQTWNTYSHLYPQEEERALQILNSI